MAKPLQVASLHCLFSLSLDLFSIFPPLLPLPTLCYVSLQVLQVYIYIYVHVYVYVYVYIYICVSKCLNAHPRFVMYLLRLCLVCFDASLDC